MLARPPVRLAHVFSFLTGIFVALAMTYLSTKLRERGLKVLIVPEIATIIANGGGMINVQKLTRQQVIKLQVLLPYNECTTMQSLDCDHESSDGPRGPLL